MINNYADKIEAENIWLIYLAVIFSLAPYDLAKQNIEKLSLTKKENKILSDFFALKNSAEELTTLTEKYDIYNHLKAYCNEAIVAFQCIIKNPDETEKVHLYLNKLINVKLSVTGNDIKSFGIADGEIYKSILNSTLQVKMNNNLSEEEEKKYFKEICKSIKTYSKYEE